MYLGLEARSDAGARQRDARCAMIEYGAEIIDLRNAMVHKS